MTILPGGPPGLPLHPSLTNLQLYDCYRSRSADPTRQSRLSERLAQAQSVAGAPSASQRTSASAPPERRAPSRGLSSTSADLDAAANRSQAGSDESRRYSTAGSNKGEGGE